jgi:hypothetical protein
MDASLPTTDSDNTPANGLDTTTLTAVASVDLVTLVAALDTMSHRSSPCHDRRGGATGALCGPGAGRRGNHDLRGCPNYPRRHPSCCSDCPRPRRCRRPCCSGGMRHDHCPQALGCCKWRCRHPPPTQPPPCLLLQHHRRLTSLPSTTRWRPPPSPAFTLRPPASTTSRAWWPSPSTSTPHNTPVGVTSLC